MKKARYIRQSSKSQTNLRQLAKAHPDETLFIDVISGSVPFAERPEGKKLIESVESGSITYLTFHDLSRAGRSTIDVLTTLSFFQSKGVVVKIDNLGLESIVNGKVNPIFNLITTVLSEINSLGNSAFLVTTSTPLCSFEDDLTKNLNSLTLSGSASIFLNRVVSFLPLNPHVQQLYD